MLTNAGFRVGVAQQRILFLFQPITPSDRLPARARLARLNQRPNSRGKFSAGVKKNPPGSQKLDCSLAHLDIFGRSHENSFPQINLPGVR
jgi:hypothetical protein